MRFRGRPALGATPEAILARLDYLRPDTDPSGPGWLELIGKPAALVIIDGVTEAFSVCGVASKDNDEVTGWLRRVPKAIADGTGAAVVLVDHGSRSAPRRSWPP